MKNLSPLHAESRVSWLAHTASACLIDEARLSPKPGLVDSRGNGAHQDLNLDLMERSARSLQPTFHALAQQSWQRPADIALRETVGRLGREGEAQMMMATGGVNTHRGAIWALGLLVSAVAMLGGEGQSQAIAAAAAALARLPDGFAPKSFSKGLRASRRWQVPGAREEAQRGFPHVTTLALPQLRQSRARGASEPQARLD
ncbi:TPA: triphosphoribosyl-dephospho-CoA synthase MdcB, partial [Klebsiella variicola]|nr:triphosphoribosyl-dephospho-CoA synthase MdcB [Klebsiella variicola]